MLEVTKEKKDGIDVLVVRLPYREERSKSGKTTLVASTHGNQPTTLTHEGKPVVVSVNAYYKNPK